MSVRRRLLGIVITTSLLGLAWLMVLGPSPAQAQNCTDNGNGTTTCTQTSQQPFFCPTSLNATSSGFARITVPSSAAILDHQLHFDVTCPGSTLSSSFNPNAGGVAPPGDVNTQVDWTWTCTPTPANCTGGAVKPFGTSTVTYQNVGGSAVKPPPANPIAFAHPKIKLSAARAEAVQVLIERGVSPAAAIEQSEVVDWTLQDWVMFGLANARPVEPKSAGSLALTSAGKRIGTLGDGHLAAGQTTVQLPLTLNKRGRKALLASGKLRAKVSCRVSDSAGSTPFSGKLKLVLKKSKK
jgi:hypothetical protein